MLASDLLFVGDDLSVADKARLALKHHLYVRDWQMCRQLHLAKINQDNYLMELAWADGRPVGVAIARHQDRPGQPCKRLVVQAYVKTKHRRQGIGSALIRCMVDEREKVSGLGIKGSDLFWKSLNVAPDDMVPGTPKEKWQYF